MIATKSSEPIWPAWSRGTSRAKWPWRQLEIGESFLMPFDHRPPMTLQQRASAQCVMTGVRLGKKFSTRMTDEGVRVWRVA